MLANSWARAGGMEASCRTRLAADARSAARSRAVLTRPGRGLAAGLPAAPAEPRAEPLAAGGEGDGVAPGGMTSLALSWTRCCSCWLSKEPRVRDRLAVTWSAPIAARYRPIR